MAETKDPSTSPEQDQKCIEFPPKASGYIPGVIIKFKDDAAPPYQDGILDKLKDPRWLELVRSFPGIQLRRLFTLLSPERLSALVEQARRQDRCYNPINFFGYFRIDCPAGVNPQSLVKAISQWPSVQNVYFDPPGNEPSNGGSPPIQEYLGEAPKGIDARYAQTINGGRGNGQHFVDMERGWDLSHPDLSPYFERYRGPSPATFTGTILQGSIPHGTSVLGVVCALDNNQWCIGITPNLTFVDVVSYWGNSRPDAISAAIDKLPFGGVLLLEAQLSLNEETDSASDNQETSLLPIEIQSATFQVIRLATALGITVIEAAGNGSVNLDTIEVRHIPPEYNVAHLDMLKRNNKEIFRDSGAIIVGAGVGENRVIGEIEFYAWNRASFSNYGERVDCFAWGENVTTLTSPYSDEHMGITTEFNGTSSASAIIAGAALAVQGVAQAEFGCCLDAQQMRALLSDGTLGTNSQDDLIGVMPNLKTIIDSFLDAPHPSGTIPDVCPYFRDFDTDAGMPHDSLDNIWASPDIIIPTTVTRRESFDLTLKVRNRGVNEASNVLVKIFSSRNAALTTTGSNPLLIPSNWKLLGPGKLLTVSNSTPTLVSFTCAGDNTPDSGDYVLIALIDQGPNQTGVGLPYYLPENFWSISNFQKFISRNIKAACHSFTVS